MGHDRKHLRAPPMGAPEKENQPPTKAKRTVSVSTLFNRRKNSKPSRHAHRKNILEATPTGITKMKSSKSKGHRSRPDTESGAIRYAFAKTIDEYRSEHRSGVAHCKSEQLDPAYNELTARVENTISSTVSSEQLLVTPNSELKGLMYEQIELSDPLEEEAITVRATRTDSTIVTEDVKLGDTMQAFQKLLGNKRVQFEKLLEELHQVDAEIVAVKKEIRTIENKEVKEVKRYWDDRLSRRAEEAREARDSTMAEVAKAVKKEKEAAEEEKRKMQEILNTI